MRIRVLLLDTETTGLLLPEGAALSEQPQIIEFGATVCDEYLNEVGEEHSILINPGRPLPEKITKITGITDADLVDKRDFAYHAPTIIDLINSCDVIIAHNVNFDIGMIRNELKRIVDEGATADDWVDWREKRLLCTVEETMYIKNKRMNLASAYKYLTGKDAPQGHRALDDVRTLLRVAQELLEQGVIKL